MHVSTIWFEKLVSAKKSDGGRGNVGIWKKKNEVVVVRGAFWDTAMTKSWKLGKGRLSRNRRAGEKDGLD